MKVYLDDIREAPEGWVRTKTVDETIELLKTGDVTDLSLDHDLALEHYSGDYSKAPTGYDVLVWMEQECFTNHEFVPPGCIFLHTANPSVIDKMQQAVQKINSSQQFRMHVHICTGLKVRPYHSVMCSLCDPVDLDRSVDMQIPLNFGGHFWDGAPNSGKMVFRPMRKADLALAIRGMWFRSDADSHRAGMALQAIWDYFYGSAEETFDQGNAGSIPPGSGEPESEGTGVCGQETEAKEDKGTPED